MTKLCITIIDDGDIDRLILKRNLKETGMEIEITEYENGADAIKEMTDQANKGTQPDFMFLDINMPIMNGFEFLEAYQSLTQEMTVKPSPIVMYSHSLDNEDKNRAEAFNFVEYRDKGKLGKEELLSILSNL